MVRVVVAHPATLLGFRHALRQRLAHLQRHRAGVCVLALAEDARGGAQPLRALRRRRAAPLARRGVGALEDPGELVGRRLLEGLEHLAGGGVGRPDEWADDDAWRGDLHCDAEPWRAGPSDERWRGQEHIVDWPEAQAGPEYWMYKRAAEDA